MKVTEDGRLMVQPPSSGTMAKAVGYGRINLVDSGEQPPPPPLQQDESATGQASPNLPDRFQLAQNYPNPFNPTTTIKYELPAATWVSLKVYNLFGQEVATLVEGMQNAGYKTARWNASDVSSGVYFYRLRAGAPSSSSGQVFLETKKLLLMK